MKKQGYAGRTSGNYLMDHVSTVIVQHGISPRPATASAFADHKSNKAATKSLGLMPLGAPSLTEPAALIKGAYCIR